jgi:hypothetical protein
MCSPHFHLEGQLKSVTDTKETFFESFCSPSPPPPPPPPPPSPSQFNKQFYNVERRKLSWELVSYDALLKDTIWNKVKWIVRVRGEHRIRQVLVFH